MTKLLLVKENERVVWVMAVIDEDVWTYVANTGKFHRNDAVREDYLIGAAFRYDEISVREAREAIADGVGLLDEQARAVPLRTWRADENALAPDVVFSSAVADLR